jgi:hypothetical protein
MQIQLLSNQVTTQTDKNGKPMQVLEVAYKNLTFQGKVESKKLFDFGVQANTFKSLVTARPSDVYEVEVVKNKAGYNDWVKVTKGSATTVGEQGASKATGGLTNAPSVPAKGGWETPDERAKKQIYIVRQSSLSNAVATLTVGRKSEVKPEDVIELAKRYEDFVFGDSQSQMASKDVSKLDGFEDDLDVPF